VAKSGPAIQERFIGPGRGLNTFRQCAIKSRVAAGYIFSECIERALEGSVAKIERWSRVILERMR
jgi:hypothetical protein